MPSTGSPYAARPFTDTQTSYRGYFRAQVRGVQPIEHSSRAESAQVIRANPMDVVGRPKCTRSICAVLPVGAEDYGKTRAIADELNIAGLFQPKGRHGGITFSRPADQAREGGGPVTAPNFTIREDARLTHFADTGRRCKLSRA